MTNEGKMKRASLWRLRTKVLSFSHMPKIMGIINVTPDSFSDGGSFFDPHRAIDHAVRMANEGADILDIGGESTRPYSTAVDEAEELRRVLPVIRGVVDQTNVPVSIDTSKAKVAAEAVAAGAEIINDVTGLEGDSAMPGVARESKVGVCAMHMRGTPQNMQDDPRYKDVVGEIREYLRRRRDALLSAGIDIERICLDPGIGFGKSHQHNLTLLAECWQFHGLECPILVGHSRKGFIGKILGDKQADRTAATIGVSLALASQGVQILRVHDVRPTRDALLLYGVSYAGKNSINPT